MLLLAVYNLPSPPKCTIDAVHTLSGNFNFLDKIKCCHKHINVYVQAEMCCDVLEQDMCQIVLSGLIRTVGSQVRLSGHQVIAIYL